VKDLLPSMRENFNARRTFRKAVDMVRLVNLLGKKDFTAVDEHVVGTQKEGAS